MFILLAFVSSLLNASAFVPVGRVSPSFALKMGFESEIGAQPPLGFWDPLGLLKNVDQERFDRLRKVETKHGRIAMLAIVGHIITAAGGRCSGDIAFGVPFTSVKPGLAALSSMPKEGLVQLFIFIGLLETGYAYVEDVVAEDCVNRMNDAKWSEAKQRSKYAIELNNGRAAQMGILALMVHEKLDNNPYIINSILGSPVPFN
jgi:hypothetical protein